MQHGEELSIFHAQSPFVNGTLLTLPIRAASASEWYDPHDYYGVTLAPSVAQYLDSVLRRFAFRRSITQVCILLCCPALGTQQQAAVRNLVKSHCTVRATQLLHQLMLLGGIAAVIAIFCGLFIGGCFAVSGAANLLFAAAFAVFLGALLLCLTKTAVLLRDYCIYQKMNAARIEFKQSPATDHLS